MRLKTNVFEDQVFFAAVRIAASTKKGNSIGTGFIYKLELDEKKALMLLVTNKHVIEGCDSISLVFNRKHKGRKLPKLGDTLTVNINDPEPLTYNHPLKSVDLACLNISSIFNMPDEKLFFKNLHTDILYDYSGESLHAGSMIYFVGYPENRFDIKNNLPILRAGTIATIPKVNYNGKRQFLIDAQVFPGSSGSPVYSVINGHYRLIGVVVQTMIRNQQLQTLPALYLPQVEQVIGLGIVIKSIELKRLFDSVKKKYENKYN